MDWSKIIENINLGLTIIMAVVPLFKDVIDRRDPNKPFINKITLGGWVLISAGALIIILNYFKQGFDEKKNKKENKELIDIFSGKVDTSLAKYHLELNKNTGEVKGKKDTVTVINIIPSKTEIKEDKPEFILNDINIPNAYIENGVFWVYFKVKNAPAYVTSYRFLVFFYYGDKIYFKPYIDTGSYNNQLKEIFPEANPGFGLILSKITYPNIKYKDVYVVLQIKFKDKHNHKQPLFERIFYLTAEEIENKATGKIEIGQMPDSEYKKMKDLLAKGKY